MSAASGTSRGGRRSKDTSATSLLEPPKFGCDVDMCKILRDTPLLGEATEWLPCPTTK